jgi:hypothetical protein
MSCQLVVGGAGAAEEHHRGRRGWAGVVVGGFAQDGVEAFAVGDAQGAGDCPVTGKSARCMAADLRGPDWMAKVRRPVVMGNWPPGATAGIFANESGPIGTAKAAGDRVD